MQVSINGEVKELKDGLLVSELLEQLELKGKFVAVERNRNVVSYKDYDKTVLCDNDQLEIVTLVGGG